MKPSPQPLIFGLVMLALGLGLLFAIDDPIPRFAGGITAFVIGLSALRHAFRLE